MGGTGAMIFLVAFVTLGLSMWGLFNRGRSILCALAGILVALGAGMGVLHAWGESRSVPWTVAYVGAALVGIVCVLRQAKPKKPQPSSREAEPVAASDGLSPPPS